MCVGKLSGSRFSSVISLHYLSDQMSLSSELALLPRLSKAAKMQANHPTGNSRPTEGVMPLRHCGQPQGMESPSNTTWVAAAQRSRSDPDELIPCLLHSVTNLLQRAVVADHDVSIFEAFVVG
jgi:hypothetical protein